jgi:hypothetical protein
MDTPGPFVQHVPYIAGLDIGQMADPTALAILERDVTTVTGKLRSRYDARWLERFPLQTPYPELARLVQRRVEKLGQQCIVVLDVTGVGRGMVDLFREAWMTVHPVTGERHPRSGKPSILAVTLLTSAMHQARTPSWDEIHVPKREVVMAFMLALQQQRFRAAKGLREAEVLFKEGQNFQWKVSSKSLQDQYGAWRDGEHDDLLLATALGVWWGEQHGPRVHRSAGRQQYATPSASPLAPRQGPRRQQVAAGGMRH